jgi:hypothetical protein
MNIAFFLRYIWFLWLPISACQFSLKPVNVSEETPGFMIVQSDKLGNYFVVNREGALQKFDIMGKVSFSYANLRMGRITSFDATDPMKILVFFRESQQLIVLDNTLSEISNVHLNQMQGRYFSSVARTLDGSLVLFDNHNELVLKTNDKLQIEDESFPLFQEGFPGYKPQQMNSNSGNIVLNDPKRGFIIMDNYLDFRKFVPLLGAILIQVNDDELIYLKKDKLFKMDLIFYEERNIQWPDKQTVPTCFCYENQQVILFDHLKL